VGNIQYQIALAYKLSPKLAELLLVLYKQPVVPIETADAMLVHRLRKEIKSRGIKIETKRYLGYWLTDETKLAIEKAINPQMG
jgi:DNA-binding response OmpR family regulator